MLTLWSGGVQHVERMGKLGDRWPYILQGAESSRILCEEHSLLRGELSLHGEMRWEA